MTQIRLPLWARINSRNVVTGIFAYPFFEYCAVGVWTVAAVLVANPDPWHTGQAFHADHCYIIVQAVMPYCLPEKAVNVVNPLPDRLMGCPVQVAQLIRPECGIAQRRTGILD